MKRTMSYLSIVVLAVVLGAPAGSPRTVLAAGEAAAGAGYDEKHPEIHRAMHALQNAKNNLEHASHDFGGHRAKALEHVNAALAECQLALQNDKN